MLNRYKSSGTYHFPEELTQSRDVTLYSEIHKLINSIWNKGKLLHQWKEFIKRVIIKDITVINYTHKIVPNTVLSKLTPHLDKTIGDHQCGFWHNRWSSTNQILCIRYWRKCGSKMVDCGDMLFTLLHKMEISDHHTPAGFTTREQAPGIHWP